MKLAMIPVCLDDGQTAEDRRTYVIERIHSLCQKAEKKPDLILLPELWYCGFFDYDAYLESASRTEEIQAELSRLAEEYRVWIVSGSLICEENGRYYNENRIYDRQGLLKNRYRKIHLFGYESQETRLLTPGDELCLTETEFGILGLATCYDLRFPEQFRAMTDRGAVGFLISSAWPLSREAHWRLFTGVRGLENQSFLAACNCSGIQNGVSLAGQSRILDPQGRDLSVREEEACLTADLDLNAAREYRRSFPALADRVEFC